MIYSGYMNGTQKYISVSVPDRPNVPVCTLIYKDVYIYGQGYIRTSVLAEINR